LQGGSARQILIYSRAAQASDGWSSQRNLSVSGLYDLTDRSAIMLTFSHLEYTFDLSIQHGTRNYFGYGESGIQRNANMVQVGYRLYQSNKSKSFSQIGSVAIGVAYSVPSTAGYYYGMENYDSSYTSLKSGYALVGMISYGVQYAPFSFLHLFAQLEIPISGSLDLFPGPIALRGGVGIPIFRR